MLHIHLNSVFVDDQAKALAFYTDKLGFEARHDVPVGEFRWLTVGTPGTPTPELLLEPGQHPAAKTYKEALMADGIPVTSFAVDDLQAEVARLEAAGVVITQPPADMGTVAVATLDDTCGNLIQLVETKD